MLIVSIPGMNLMENNICVCGHFESEHCHKRNNPCSCDYKYCDYHGEVGGNIFLHCKGFKQDNLKYLESIYDSRNK